MHFHQGIDSKTFRFSICSLNVVKDFFVRACFFYVWWFKSMRDAMFNVIGVAVALLDTYKS